MKRLGEVVGIVGIVPLIAGIYFIVTAGDLVASIVLLGIGAVLVVVGGALAISRPTTVRTTPTRTPSQGAWR